MLPTGRAYGIGTGGEWKGDQGHAGERNPMATVPGACAQRDGEPGATSTAERSRELWWLIGTYPRVSFVREVSHTLLGSCSLQLKRAAPGDRKGLEPHGLQGLVGHMLLCVSLTTSIALNPSPAPCSRSRLSICPAEPRSTRHIVDESRRASALRGRHSRRQKKRVAAWGLGV